MPHQQFSLKFLSSFIFFIFQESTYNTEFIEVRVTKWISEMRFLRAGNTQIFWIYFLETIQNLEYLLLSFSFYESSILKLFPHLEGSTNKNHPWN